jgi:hypothetical protein
LNAQVDSIYLDPSDMFKLVLLGENSRSSQKLSTKYFRHSLLKTKPGLGSKKYFIGNNGNHGRDFFSNTAEFGRTVCKIKIENPPSRYWATGDFFYDAWTGLPGKVCAFAL